MTDQPTNPAPHSLLLGDEIFRLMVESAKDYAIFSTDDRGRVTTWNAGAERVLGFKEGEIVGRDVRIVFTPEDNERGRADFEMQESLRTGRAEDRRWHMHKDGRRFWADGLMFPLKDDRKQAIGFLKVIRDRTAEKHSDDSRVRAESDLRLMLESATDFAIFTLSPDHRVASWNGGAARMFGHSEEDIIGQAGEVLFVPEDRAAGMPEVELKIAEQEGRAEDERWHQKKDGGRFFASGVSTPIRDEDGTLIGFTKVCRDITERKRAADEFAEQAEKNRLQAKLLDLSHVMVRDLEGRILFWNQGTESLYGWSREEAIGQVCYQLLKARFPEPFDDIDAKLLRHGHWHGEVGHTRKDGTELVVSMVMTLHEGEQGRLVLESSSDITDRKELERSLRHQALELAEADRKKNEFLAMLAHELRNPLAGISSAIRLAQDSEMGDQVPFAHEVIERQARNLSRLIDDLLDVSRITQGKVELKREVVDVPGVIHRAAEAVGPLIERRRHELTIQVTGGPMYVEADPTRLEQVVGNLLTNAAKYSEEGGQITVTARKQGGRAVISVKDTGVGISPEMLPRVFDLFTQVDPTLARSEGGLGIGLSLVKQLVEMHGGAIEAMSEPGKGSEFTVRIPLVAKAPEPVGPKARPNISGRGKRILIVDDNADTARLTGKILAMMSFAVEIAHDGHAAIEVARRHRPEVVLLDIGLPGMDGFEVARQLRQEAFCQETLIIAVSGYGDEDARRLAREAGFDHHLVKPVDVDELLPLIENPTDRV